MKNKLFNNAAWIIGGNVVKSLLSVVVAMLTARYLGPEKYGSINYAAGLVAFAAPLMKLGLSAILVREIVNRQNEEGKILGTVIGLNLISSLFCIIGITAFSVIANTNETETIVVCAIYSSLLICQAIEMIQYWFQAKLLSKYTAFATILAYICITLFKITLIIAKKSVYWFAASSSVEYGILALILLVIYYQKGGQRLSFSVAEAKQLLNVSRYYILAELMVVIFAQTDKIMLKLMIDSTAVGYYSAAVSCANILGFVFYAVIDSARPVILEARQISAIEFEKKTTMLYSVIFYSSLVVSSGITLFAPLIVKILYGLEYASAVAPLRLIVWYIAFSLFGSVRNIWILAEKKQKYLWRINICGAITNVLLNAIIIPIWGIMGAAFTSLVTQIFTNVIVGFIIKPIRKNNELMLLGMDIRLIVRLMKNMLSETINHSNSKNNSE